MTSDKIHGLKSFTNGLRTRSLDNLKSIEASLMQIIKVYIDTDLNSKLQTTKKNILELRDELNTYRIPPILLKKDKKKSNYKKQLKVIISYSELILIETESLLFDFEKGVSDVKNDARIERIHLNFSDSYDRILKLITQLEEYDKFGEYKDIFKTIASKIKPLYPKPKKIKKFLKLSKKLKLLELEKQKIPELYEKRKKIKKTAQEAYSEIEISEEVEEEGDNPIITEVINRVSYKVLRDQLAEIVNSLSESVLIKDQGGLVKINTLYNMIKENNEDLDFSIADLSKTMKYMKKKGFINDIEEIENMKLIKFVPLELSDDPKKLLKAVGFEGVDTKENLIKKLNWDDIRVESVLAFLIEKKICKSSTDSIEGTKYYFPGLK